MIYRTGNTFLQQIQLASNIYGCASGSIGSATNSAFRATDK